MPWKNGGGETREIYRFPEQGGDWQWRLSIADISSDGPFSSFPGCERALTLLSGEGMHCTIDGETVPVLPPHQTIRFSGEAQVSCHLLDGPTRDFNAIWRRDLWEISVERCSMVGALWCIPEPEVQWFVYFLSGSGRIKDDPDSPLIAAGDGLALYPRKGEPRLVLDAHGEALWLKIRRR